MDDPSVPEPECFSYHLIEPQEVQPATSRPMSVASLISWSPSPAPYQSTQPYLQPSIESSVPESHELSSSPLLQRKYAPSPLARFSERVDTSTPNPTALATPQPTVRGSRARKARIFLTEEDKQTLMGIVVSQRSEYANGKTAFWDMIRALFKEDTGKDVSSLRLTVGKLVDERKAAVDAEANDTGRGNTETDLTNKIDTWIEFLADIEAKETAKRMTQEERERNKQLATKRKRALLFSSQGSSAMADSDDNLENGTPGAGLQPSSTPIPDDNETDGSYSRVKRQRLTGRRIPIALEGLDVVANAIDGLGTKVAEAMGVKDTRIDGLITDVTEMKQQMEGLVKAEDLHGMEERIGLLFSSYASNTQRSE